MMFKLGVYWSALTPQIQAKIVRDVLDLQHLAKVSQDTLLTVAGPQELSDVITTAGVKFTTDMSNLDMCRVYAESPQNVPQDLWDKLPTEGVEPELVYLSNTNSKPPQNTLPADPYAGVPMRELWKRIPETEPLEQTPPRGRTEPLFSPWL